MHYKGRNGNCVAFHDIVDGYACVTFMFRAYLLDMFVNDASQDIEISVYLTT